MIITFSFSLFCGSYNAWIPFLITAQLMYENEEERR